MMRINILLLFFMDSWPAHMITFFHTARHSNPGVNFTLITNLNFSHASWSERMHDLAVPPNVKLVRSSFEEIKMRIMDQNAFELDFRANVKLPYKLADFAPAYGKLFKEELEGYTHWGYSGNDVFLGDMLDVYEAEYQDEDLLFFDRKLYFNSLSVVKTTDLGLSMYKSVPNKTLHYVFRQRPKAPIGFDEEIITCHLMLNPNVTARAYDAECANRNLWWYQGKMFDNRKKCLMFHFGGGSRSFSTKLKKGVMKGMHPYFHKGYHLNASIGFGIMGNFYVFFTVNPDASIDIIEYTTEGRDTEKMTAVDSENANNGFQNAYRRLYLEAPVPTGSPEKMKGVSTLALPSYTVTGSAIPPNAQVWNLLGNKCKTHVLDVVEERKKHNVTVQ